MKRLTDWAGYAGLLGLVAAILLPWVRPQWSDVRWALVLAGLALVVLSVVGRVGGLRTVLAGRSARYGLNTAVMILLLLGIIGLVEAVSYRHNARLDLTSNKRHSLSPQTIQLLGRLKTDVNAVAFFRSDQPGKRLAEDLLKQYARHAGARFTWKVVDPDREPGLARQYAVESYGTIVLETKIRSEKVLDAEEEKLTNGLVKVTREGKRIVYVLQGHGEHELTNTERPGFSEAKSAMERANYEVKPLVLAREAKVPDDAALVIVAGPRTDPFPPELTALDAYVGRGGKLLVMVDPPFPDRVQTDGLTRYLTKYGVELGENLVVETNPIGQLFGINEPLVPVILQYEPHPITRDMGGVATLFPLTRSVAGARTPPQGVTVQPLVRTSPQSWGETDREALRRGQAQLGPGDLKGPVPIAAVVTRDKARIVVFGTSNVAANQFLNVQGNRDFFLNTVSWLAEEEDQIAIRPKDTKQTPIFMNASEARVAFLLPVLILPGLVLVGGIATLVRRRAAK
ncbi:MAG: GldG family protein [Candidatus Rokubacteria bacterium]|nr:GldG family protein [Candidatus Rokubacteria bacterium]